MKKFFSMKYIKAIAMFLIMIFIVGQFEMGNVEAQAAETPKLSATHLSLTVGQNKKLKVSNAKKVTWKSSKESVASVSKNGTIKAKKQGTAVITAKIGKKTLRCKVTVRNKKNTDNKIPSSGESSILVAYFSWSGTSESIAKQIIAQTGADSFRIEREIPYSDDYSATAEEAEKEWEKNARPAIKNPLKSIKKYEKIVVCYPIWWHTAPMTVGTFLETYDWTGKTIYPVSQSASMDRSQYEQSVAFIETCAKGAKVDDGLFSTNSSRIQDYVSNTIR